MSTTLDELVLIQGTGTAFLFRGDTSIAFYASGYDFFLWSRGCFAPVIRLLTLERGIGSTSLSKTYSKVLLLNDLIVSEIFKLIYRPFLFVGEWK